MTFDAKIVTAILVGVALFHGIARYCDVKLALGFPTTRCGKEITKPNN